VDRLDFATMQNDGPGLINKGLILSGCDEGIGRIEIYLGKYKDCHQHARCNREQRRFPALFTATRCGPLRETPLPVS
jgi:hypothetical protein